MPRAALPATEAERLAALRACDILDTRCEAAFDDLTSLAAALTGSPIALISLVDADRQWFKSRQGLDAEQTSRDASFCAHAILDPTRLLMVKDAARDPRFADNPLVTGEPKIRFYAGAPLVTPDGHALGTLCVIDHVPRALDTIQQRTLTSLARAVVTTIELHRTAIRVRDMALTDPLTGIANRRAFLDALAEAIACQRRDGDAFGLLYLDLDGFKRVNDMHGHAAGDAVLRDVSAALASCMRRADLPARIGGDELAAILTGIEGVNVPAIAERVRLAVRARMALLDRPVTVSVGAVSFLGAPADEAGAIAAVDSLMYAAKAAGKDRVMHCSVGEETATPAPQPAVDLVA
ncbi:diguanylate cyclase [Dankookia sp. P2]|uniref:GGDEF domain-containing protein n=1 Tax=Dankookia sp. P2 TaxID=3423955 RepID=UPI003D671778